MEIETFRAMNTNIQLGAEGTDPQAIRDGFSAAQHFVHEKEKQFTRFSSTSELSKLNQVRGAWFNVSEEMLEVISLARDFVEETSGLFDPSILPDLHRAGYDRSMDIIREHGALPGSWNAHPNRPAFDDILIRPEERLVSLPMDMSLDLGGIAKGWIAEKAAGVLAQFVPVCIVNAGGDLFTVGTPSGSGCWEVDIEDPFAAEQTAAIL
ncbi:MAG: FAD:protein FMN transferase, partial [Chloroflexota bacterium]